MLQTETEGHEELSIASATCRCVHALKSGKKRTISAYSGCAPQHVTTADQNKKSAAQGVVFIEEETQRTRACPMQHTERCSGACIKLGAWDQGGTMPDELVRSIVAGGFTKNANWQEKKLQRLPTSTAPAVCGVRSSPARVTHI